MIEVSHVIKSFGNRQILRDVSLKVNARESICIIGPMGCGKSTLMRCIAGLETLDSGQILLEGIPRKPVEKQGGSQKVGMVFQSFNLFPHLTVLNNLMLAPCKVLRMSKEEAEKEAVHQLELVGLAEKMHLFPHELSPGQRQRVAMARCLVMKPQVLLLDEITSALDPMAAGEVKEVLRKLKQEVALILITHDMNLVSDIADRVVFMADGRIVEVGTSDEVFNHPKEEATRIFVNRIRDYHYAVCSHRYDLYELHAGMAHFCERYNLSNEQKFKVQLLSEEVLQVVPLDKGVIDLYLRYSEKERTLSLELLMPTGIISVLNDKESVPDEFSMAIIEGLCDHLSEVMEEHPEGPRVKLCLSLKDNTPE